jgi:four helix bundle protein
MSLHDFELYQLAIEFLRLANDMLQRLPRGYSELKDQLNRAALSVVLNTAEGAGKYSRAEQKRHYAIARGSAFECCAVVDVIRVLGLIEKDYLARSGEVIDRIIAILTKLSGQQ